MTQRVSSPVFVGRAAEVAQLRAALERARSGSPATVVVAGEAGVGKTRLVGEILDHAQELGLLTLVGGCLDVGDGVVAYAPIVEALRSLVGTVEPAQLDRALGAARGELARLVPELGGQADPAGTIAPGRLFELLLGVLHRLAEHRAVLLVAEDLHWADESTRHLLGFLVRNLRGRVALVGTYRSDELHRRHPLRPLLAELERSGRAERVDLARLDRGELGELVAEIRGERPAPGVVDEILARSEGNPFFAEELVAARVEGVTLPEALRDVLLARVEALPEETQQLLQVAAVAGQQVDHELLAAVADLPPARLVEQVREAVAHHFLVVQDGGEGYAFRHALVQEAVYDDLLPAQRIPLHAACARALAGRVEQPSGRHGGGSVAVLGQLARHWDAAGNRDEALVASVRAGEAAETASAVPEAQRHYQRALELWEQAPEAAARSPLPHPILLLRAAQAMSLVKDTEGAAALVSKAVAETDPAAEPLLAGALLERLGRYQWLNGDSAMALTVARQALATIPAEPPSPERARALAGIGQMLMAHSRHQPARAHCEEAVAVARQVGARAVEGHALNTLGVSLGCQGHLEAATAHLEHAHAIAEELGDPEDRFRAHSNWAEVLIRNGRCADALPLTGKARELAGQFGARTHGMIALAYEAEALLWLGRMDEVDRLIDEAFSLDVPDRAVLQLRLTRAMRHVRRGDLPAASADLTAVQDAYQDPQDASRTLSLLATAAIWDGRLDEARAAAGKGMALLDGVEQPDLVLELCVAGLEAEAAIAERAAARRDTAARDAAIRIAADLIGRAKAASESEGVLMTRPGTALLLTAEAHHSRVTGSSDPDRWASAVTAWDGLGYPWQAADARWRHAEALLDAGGSRQQAAPPLRQAWADAGRLGARLLTAETEALGRRARIELAPAVSSRPDGPAPDTDVQRLGLTPREREVLALVADGRTNRQIAEALYISDKTAGVHVSNILGKLGVANRAEAAVAAHRLGILDRRPGEPTTP